MSTPTTTVPSLSTSNLEVATSGPVTPKHLISPELSHMAVLMEAVKLNPLATRDQGEACLTDLAESLEEFGQPLPLLVAMDGTIVVGNGLYRAACKLGWTHIAVVRTNMPELKANAFAVAHNQLAMRSSWNSKNLKAIVDGLAKSGCFGRLLSKKLWLPQTKFAKMSGTKIEKTTKRKEAAITRKGDLWILGDHRLGCGDSRIQEEVNKLIGPGEADLCVTDPPYGVKYESEDGKTVEGDDFPPEVLYDLLFKALTCAYNALKPGAVFYIFHAGQTVCTFRDAEAKAGLKWHKDLQWVKNTFVMNKNKIYPEFHQQNEPIHYGFKDGANRYWCDDRTQATILEFNKPTCNGPHPTMKPIDLIERLINMSSRKSEVVLDLFGGSGSTLIAAQRTGRRARLMEKMPEHCDTTIERWEAEESVLEMGFKAVLESSLDGALNGKTFEEVAEIRKAEAPAQAE